MASTGSKVLGVVVIGVGLVAAVVIAVSVVVIVALAVLGNQLESTFEAVELDLAEAPADP